MDATSPPGARLPACRPSRDRHKLIVGAGWASVFSERALPVATSAISGDTATAGTSPLCAVATLTKPLSEARHNLMSNAPDASVPPSGENVTAGASP